MKSCFLLVVIGLTIMAWKDQAEAKLQNSAVVHLGSGSDTIGKSWFNDNTRSYSRKRKFFLQFGLNWSGYGRSDINFDGPGYDFTLEDVRARDEPYKSSLQYNIHAGYFITDRYSISLGFDHMKYLMVIPQQLQIDGTIQPEISNPVIQTGPYSGEYSDQTITVSPEMLTLEYTDGFNILGAHVQRYDDVWIANNRRTSLSLETGVAAGVVIPRSEVRLFGVGENNDYNIAGWTASAKAGLMFNFNKRFYFLANLQAGYANMHKIFTTGRNDTDKASQKLNFLQNMYFIGLRF